MTIDHIFIFTDDNGKIADELEAFGLSEGSSRVHVGQGTTNRKFYFENFFLEILWVHDHVEFQSEKIKNTGLVERTSFASSNFSPFGLCLVNAEDTDNVFVNAYKYQPEYFPGGMEIDILKNENNPSLPWTFRLPFKGQKKNETEPIIHKIGIGKLSKAIFEYVPINGENDFIKHFQDDTQIVFKPSERYWLNLIFDNKIKGKKRVFGNLYLTIEF